MFQRIKGYFANITVPNTVGFILFSALISTGVNRGFKYWDDRNDAHDKAIATFVQSANSLDALVGFYVEAVTQNTSSLQKARDQLYSNLNAQIHNAQSMEFVLSGREKEDTEKYINSLDKLISSLQDPNSSDVLTMKDFWYRVAQVVTLRNNLSVQLQS